MSSLADRLGSAAYTARYADRASDLHELVKDEPPPRDWLIPGYLERGSHTVLAGRGGSAKTMFLWQLGVQAAQRHPEEFPYGLGLLAPDATTIKVALVDAEMGPMKYRYRTWDTGMNEYIYPDHIKHIDAAGLDIASKQDDRDYVMEQADGYDLVVMDSLKKLSRSLVENDNDHMAAVVGDITDMSRQLRAGIFTIHHQGTDTKAFRGATAIMDQCDALIAWKVHTPHDDDKLRCLVSRGEWVKIRDGKEPEDRWFKQADNGLLVPVEAPDDAEPAGKWDAAILTNLPYAGTQAAFAEHCGAKPHNSTWRTAYHRLATVVDGVHVRRPEQVEEPEI